ncbi:MAG: SDR family oxidoreductase, partial [Gammaproteobacteria bacterium]|nr:SDR family oxidoreductase [Gammaproteobacteria bacterium]
MRRRLQGHLHLRVVRGQHLSACRNCRNRDEGRQRCNRQRMKMIRQHSGSIINNSSADGLHGANALSAYVASKFAVRGMTKVAALELGPHGVRVNSVHPGGINTPMANPQNLPSAQLDFAFKQFAAQRVGRPEEAAECFVFLASDESSYCMGSELAVDGGLTAGHYYF